MDSLIILPMAFIAVILCILALLLLFLPRTASLSLAQILVKATKTSTSGQSSLLFIPLMMLTSIFGISIVRLLTSSSHGNGMMETVDRVRAESAAALSMLDLALVLLIPALCEERRQAASMSINLEAMKRQVKGMQSEYERVTSSSAPPPPASKQGGGGLDIADEWRRKVEERTQLKVEHSSLLEAAVKARASAEAKAEALLSQVKGYDREFDRLLDENKMLKAAQGQGGARASVASMVGQRPSYTVKKDA